MKQKILTGLLLAWALLVVCATGKAQTVILQQPDCQQFFTLTTATSTASYDNRFNGCTFWAMDYSNRGFSGLTMAVQSAANATGDIPGSWGTFSGTVVTGTNPVTTTTQTYMQIDGFNPWVRVNLSGLTGTGSVQGTLYGWKLRPGGSSSSGSGCPDPCTVIQPTAASLNATVVGAGTAGTPNAGVVTIQGISSATPVVIGGSVADGVGRAGNPVPIAGRDTGNNTQDIQTNTTGRPLVVQASTALALADALSNTIATTSSADISDASATTPSSRTLPYVFNGTTWDRARGTTAGAQVQGAAADGAAVAGNPVLIGGFDGTNAQSISTNSSGQVNIVCISGCGAGGGNATGPDAPGTPSTANPVQIAGNDGTNVQNIAVDTNGRQRVVGAAADGAAVAGNPVLIGGFDGTNAQSISTNTSGQVNIVCISGCTSSGGGSSTSVAQADNISNTIDTVSANADATNPYQRVFNWVFDGTTWDRQPGNSAGGTFVQGAVAAGSAVGANPVMVGGSDGTNLRRMGVTSAGGVMPATNNHGFGDLSSTIQDTPQSSSGSAMAYKGYGYVFNSSSWDRYTKCQTSAAITLTASGLTQIVALTSNQTIYICHISLQAASPVGIQLQYGTGSNCATGTTSVSGVYQNSNGIFLDFATPSPLVLPLSQALCVNLSAAVNVGGVINYVKF